MRYGTFGTFFGVGLLCLSVVGCASLPGGEKPAGEAVVATAPAPAPAPPPAPTLDPREERRLVKELPLEDMHIVAVIFGSVVEIVIVEHHAKRFGQIVDILCGRDCIGWVCGRSEE